MATIITSKEEHGKWSKEDIDDLDHDVFAEMTAKYVSGWKNARCYQNLYIDQQGRARPDVFSLIKTYNKEMMNPSTWEIKVSRQDFLQDKKAEKYRKYFGFSKYFY